MKINEIITEANENGTPDPVAPGDAATAPPAPKRPGWAAQQMQKLNPFNTAGKHAAAGAGQVTKYSKPVIDKWNQTVGMNPAVATNPQALQQFATRYAKDSQGQPMFTPTLPTDMSPQGVKTYLSGMVAQVLTGGIGAASPTAPAATSSATAQSNLASGIKIVNKDPIIMQYKNKEFALDDNGQWIHLNSGKKPNQSFQAFLSQQHDIAGE
jgi:hypothetical protein